jgi:alpha-beta hydrolase superfamily lysophospholipase
MKGALILLFSCVFFVPMTGIASLRYDKRGIGKSMDSALKEEDLVMEDLVCDAVHLAEFLRDDERFSSVTVIGHSEGSLIGMLRFTGRAGRRVHLDCKGGFSDLRYPS